ncbi:MAG: methyltransferase [Oscillochloris sp.]|nr:methyltransferase [Oscillochloris sp.]
MLYVLQTIPGLSQLAWQEAAGTLPIEDERRGLKLLAEHPVPGRDDLILFDYTGGPRSLLKLRLSEDVFVVAARGFRIASDSRGPRQIYAAVRNSEHVESAMATWRRAGNARRQSYTYRVIAREVGQHSYIRRDISRAVSDAVRDGWPGRWQPTESDADIEIWATLLQHELICTLRLSGPEMRHRSKSQHLPASLRPALAAAMVMLSEPQRDDVFLDPMAGAGTLLLERAAAGPFAEMHGGDNSHEAVRAMEVNLRSVKGQITISRWDARRLPMENESVDAITVNLPFGKQVADEVIIHDLYQDVLKEATRVLASGGRLVALAGDWRALESARAAVTRSLRAGPRHRVIVLGQTATICTYRKI